MRLSSSARLWLVAALLGLGCDVPLPPGVVTADAPAAAGAERPEGWESLEDEGSALRLYYQFVDASRRVHFVERLEDVPEPLRATVGFVKLDVPPPLTPADAARARRAQLGETRGSTARAPGDPRAVLYSADWCGACRKAKRYLAERGVAFEERDVDQRRHADELVRRTGARAVPVIEVGGRMLTGFSASSYDALLGS